MHTEHVPHRGLTLGIDLASQAKETGACLIDWSAAPASIVDLGQSKLDDDRLLELMTADGVGKVAIDAPFGWPLAFVDAISTYRDETTWLDLPHDEVWFRATELRVSSITGLAPLSVATSNLAWPTMRLARLLTRLVATTGPVDRAGAGLVAEVYPDAALRRWEIIVPGATKAAASYKGKEPDRAQRRAAMMAKLRQRLAGQVDVDDALVSRCVADDDDLDAFVCALVARSVQLGRCDPIPPGMRWSALREGWIHLPEGPAIQLAE